MNLRIAGLFSVVGVASMRCSSKFWSEWSMSRLWMFHERLKPQNTPEQPQNKPRTTPEQPQNDPRTTQNTPRTSPEQPWNTSRTAPEQPQNNPRTTLEQPQNFVTSGAQKQVPKSMPKTEPGLLPTLCNCVSTYLKIEQHATSSMRS